MKLHENLCFGVTLTARKMELTAERREHVDPVFQSRNILSTQIVEDLASLTLVNTRSVKKVSDLISLQKSRGFQ